MWVPGCRGRGAVGEKLLQPMVADIERRGGAVLGGRRVVEVAKAADGGAGHRWGSGSRAGVGRAGGGGRAPRVASGAQGTGGAPGPSRACACGGSLLRIRTQVGACPDRRPLPSAILHVDVSRSSPVLLPPPPCILRHACAAPRPRLARCAHTSPAHALAAQRWPPRAAPTKRCTPPTAPHA